MNLDLRVPVGLLFIVLGAIMTVYGFTSDPAIYHKSLGINVNVLWGICQLIFGSLMVAFGRSTTQLQEQSAARTSHHDLPPPSEIKSAPSSVKIATRSKAKRGVRHR